MPFVSNDTTAHSQAHKLKTQYSILNHYTQELHSALTLSPNEGYVEYITSVQTTKYEVLKSRKSQVSLQWFATSTCRSCYCREKHWKQVWMHLLCSKHNKWSWRRCFPSYFVCVYLIHHVWVVCNTVMKFHLSIVVAHCDFHTGESEYLCSGESQVMSLLLKPVYLKYASADEHVC